MATQCHNNYIGSQKISPVDCLFPVHCGAFYVIVSVSEASLVSVGIGQYSI